MIMPLKGIKKMFVRLDKKPFVLNITITVTIIFSALFMYSCGDEKKKNNWYG